MLKKDCFENIPWIAITVQLKSLLKVTVSLEL